MPCCRRTTTMSSGKREGEERGRTLRTDVNRAIVPLEVLTPLERRSTVVGRAAVYLPLPPLGAEQRPCQRTRRESTATADDRVGLERDRRVRDEGGRGERRDVGHREGGVEVLGGGAGGSCGAVGQRRAEAASEGRRTGGQLSRKRLNANDICKEQLTTPSTVEQRRKGNARGAKALPEWYHLLRQSAPRRGGFILIGRAHV